MNSAQNLSNQLRDATCQKVMWHDTASDRFSKNLLTCPRIISKNSRIFNYL